VEGNRRFRLAALGSPIPYDGRPLALPSSLAPSPLASNPPTSPVRWSPHTRYTLIPAQSPSSAPSLRTQYLAISCRTFLPVLGGMGGGEGGGLGTEGP
jgi:hypothetical protein